MGVVVGGVCARGLAGKEREVQEVERLADDVVRRGGTVVEEKLQ